jgi:hypothetical protein
MAVVHQWYHCITHNSSGMRVRAATTSAVFRKSLALSTSARQSKSTGEVVNLLAVDTAKLQAVSQHIFMLWSGPLQMTLSIVFLFQQIGVSTLSGLFVMVSVCVSVSDHVVTSLNLQSTFTLYSFV